MNASPTVNDTRDGLSPAANVRARDSRVAELVSEREQNLPVWIRAPKRGTEYFTGFGRAKLYELYALGKIDSRSIRRPGQVKGTRLFNLRSILDYIESCGQDANNVKLFDGEPVQQ